jgi:hypothetical protein
LFYAGLSQTGRDQKNRETDVSSVALQNHVFFIGLASRCPLPVQNGQGAYIVDLNRSL